MTSIPSSQYPDCSRLVNLLTDLSDINLSASNHNLAERLGHLIGLSGSVALARALQQLPQQASHATPHAGDDVFQEVLIERGRMIRTIVASFAHDGNETQNKVPSADVSVRAQALLTFEPYRRFYISHQLEMAVGIQNLRSQLRTGLAQHSADLHQLAELDRTFEESLAVHNRKLFGVTLKVLEQRFKFLLKRHLKSVGDGQDADLGTWILDGAWLDLFYKDMRELLLAEFDVRLQPVLGLLEALNEQT